MSTTRKQVAMKFALTAAIMAMERPIVQRMAYAHDMIGDDLPLYLDWLTTIYRFTDTAVDWTHEIVNDSDSEDFPGLLQ